MRLFAILAGILLYLLSGLAMAEPQGAARVQAEDSHIQQDWRGRTELRLALSRGVPFRVFTLAEPPRLVMDFRDLDWTGVAPEALLSDDSGMQALHSGVFQPGWSRLVAELARPMLPEDIGMRLAEDGSAVLRLMLAPASAEDFDAAAGAPESALWPKPAPPAPPAPVADGRFVVVIDPGHGGIDPGAERDGLSEKTLMLDVAFALRDRLLQEGDVEVVLTRTEDVFVSLQARVAQAHHARADMFISLHADALSDGGARGATVYVLSAEASDAATAQLAARHNRADIIAGADLTGSDDAVTHVLLDLARQETEPRAKDLAAHLVESMAQAGGPMNNRPLRHAGFTVLKSADIPSVLVEVGFLSSRRDLENLRDPDWRAGMVDGIARGILAWRAGDAERRALLRQ
jgi:N-acetylmuramoyl-L-alanine amidase